MFDCYWHKLTQHGHYDFLLIVHYQWQVLMFIWFHECFDKPLLTSNFYHFQHFPKFTKIGVDFHDMDCVFFHFRNKWTLWIWDNYKIIWFILSAQCYFFDFLQNEELMMATLLLLRTDWMVKMDEFPYRNAAVFVLIIKVE